MIAPPPSHFVGPGGAAAAAAAGAFSPFGPAPAQLIPAAPLAVGVGVGVSPRHTFAAYHHHHHHAHPAPPPIFYWPYPSPPVSPTSYYTPLQPLVITQGLPFSADALLLNFSSHGFTELAPPDCIQLQRSGVDPAVVYPGAAAGPPPAMGDATCALHDKNLQHGNNCVELFMVN